MYFLNRWGKDKEPSGQNPSLKGPVNLFLRYKDFILALTLFWLNVLFIWPFLGQDYPQVMFATPVLPILAKTVELISPLSFAQAVGYLVLFSFPLSSFAWYLFFKKLSGSALLSFLAGLIFLLPWFYFPRFAIFWQRGDGLHALGFAFLPLVGIIFKQFLNKGSSNLFLGAFLGVSFVSLISPFALLNLYLFFLILTFSEMLLGEARIKILRFLIVGLFAQGFSSFWYHPGFLISTLQSNQGQGLVASLWKLLPLSFFTLPIIGVISFLIFDRKPHLQPIFFAFIFTLMNLGFVAAEGISGYLALPFPDRFSPEFYIGLSFFLAILINFLAKLPKYGFSLGKIHLHWAFIHHSSEMFLTMCLTAFLAWPLFSLILGSPIIPWISPPQVLGSQSIFGEISREGTSQWVGYGVSFLTAAAGVFLKIKIKA